MAFIKSSAIMALVAYFGLEVSAAPRLQERQNTLNSTSVVVMPSFTMIPVSTLSETTFVPVMPSVQPLSTSTATIDEASVVITSSTTVVPVTITPSSIPTSTSTSTLYVQPASTVHDITTAYVPRPTSIGDSAPWIQVQLAKNVSAIGGTCLSKEVGRQEEIRDCVVRSDHERACEAFDYSCQCYYLEQARNCYKKSYHDCKRDGLYEAMGYAEKEACDYAKHAGMQSFSPQPNTLGSYTTITTKLP